MEPVTIIVTALTLGIAAGLKETTAQVVKDAYEGIKDVIKRKYNQVDLEGLENDLTSKIQQTSVEEDLQKANASNDEELLSHAKELLDAIGKHEPGIAESIGVNLEDVKGASLQIEDIIASGSGVNIKGAQLTGDIQIKKVRAGQQQKGDSLKKDLG
jgi:hypothetical protein